MGNDTERNLAIGAATKLKMAEPETRAKTLAAIRERSSKPEWIESRRKIMLAAYARGSFQEKSLTKPVRAVCKMLDRLHVKYEREWVFGHYAFDFYLPEHHVCIEVQGDYWHGNPAVYAKQELTPKQKRRQNIDKTKHSYAANRGVRVLPIWERDIAKSPDECEEDIQLLIAAGFKSKARA